MLPVGSADAGYRSLAQALLDSIVAEPNSPIGHLSMIGPEERSRLLEEFNSTDVPHTELFHEAQTLHGLLEHWATATPNAPAAIFEVPPTLHGMRIPTLPATARQLSARLKAYRCTCNAVLGRMSC